MSRCAITFPAVARRSPAITTPPGKLTATIVVPCGISSPTGDAGTARRPGSNSGEYTPRNSVNEDVSGLVNSPGRRPVCESWDATRLPSLHQAPVTLAYPTGADDYDPTVQPSPGACRVIHHRVSPRRTFPRERPSTPT